MRIRDWRDIVRDVVESKGDPDDWRAVGGRRRSGLGEDMYFAHPRAGIYLLKTYAKNPFSVSGVGTHVARNLDDEIGSYLPEDEGMQFAIRSAPDDEDEARARVKRVEETLRTHAEVPTTPDALFEDVMTALDSPAFGPLDFGPRDRPDRLDGLSRTFEDAEDLLDAELDDLIEEDELDRGFM